MQKKRYARFAKVKILYKTTKFVFAWIVGRIGGESVSDKENRFCPLQLIANCVPPTCNKEGCVWYTEGKCAIVAIAENLSDMNQGRELSNSATVWGHGQEA